MSESRSHSFQFTEVRPPVDVQEVEYVRLLGFPPGHVLNERSRELAQWARDWYAENGRPWVVAHGASGVGLAPNKVFFAGADFVSERLHEQFHAAEADDAVLVAVSAGKELEEMARRCWEEGRPDEYFFLEMYGSAIVEFLVTYAAGRICGWADHQGIAVLPHYSPGYSGWPILDQVKLWEVMQNTRPQPMPAELEVLETGMLRPKKSLLAVYGLTRRVDRVQAHGKLVPCENCSLPNCQYRRTPYQIAMPQPEMIIPRQILEPASASGDGPVLDKLARYSVNPRALKKWSQERLQIETESDGCVVARFRYEGTTCSNLGRPIQYDYFVRLRPRSERYRVAEISCAPAVGDTGHMHMCEYLKNATTFMEAIGSEKPLLNQPLNDVLAWKRSGNPAGCYCEASSREHKWGIVLEVIHYTLAQRGAA